MILCGSEKPEKPDKPDKPDRPETPDRSKFVEADRVMSERTIAELQKGSLPEPDKQRFIDVIRRQHAECAAGRARCVGE